jgi:hypothetical protein
MTTFSVINFRLGTLAGEEFAGDGLLGEVPGADWSPASSSADRYLVFKPPKARVGGEGE